MNYEITRARVRTNRQKFYDGFEEDKEDIIKIIQTAKRNQILRELQLDIDPIRVPGES